MDHMHPISVVRNDDVYPIRGVFFQTPIRVARSFIWVGDDIELDVLVDVLFRICRVAPNHLENKR